MLYLALLEWKMLYIFGKPCFDCPCYFNAIFYSKQEYLLQDSSNITKHGSNGWQLILCQIVGVIFGFNATYNINSIALLANNQAQHGVLPATCHTCQAVCYKDTCCHNCPSRSRVPQSPCVIAACFHKCPSQVLQFLPTFCCIFVSVNGTMQISRRDFSTWLGKLWQHAACSTWPDSYGNMLLAHRVVWVACLVG